MSEENNSMEELTSELAFIGEKLSGISKCLRKMSNWTESDEAKYGEKDEE
jgi:hypothetical protein